MGWNLWRPLKDEKESSQAEMVQYSLHHGKTTPAPFFWNVVMDTRENRHTPLLLHPPGCGNTGWICELAGKDDGCCRWEECGQGKWKLMACVGGAEKPDLATPAPMLSALNSRISLAATVTDRHTRIPFLGEKGRPCVRSATGLCTYQCIWRCAVRLRIPLKTPKLHLCILDLTSLESFPCTCTSESTAQGFPAWLPFCWVLPANKHWKRIFQTPPSTTTFKGPRQNFWFGIFFLIPFSFVSFCSN